MATTSLTLDTVESNLRSWYAGPKSPGVIVLEHELTNDTVSGFIDTYPVAVQNGWNVVSVAQINGASAYQNAQGQTGPVTPMDNVLAADSPTSSTPTSSVLAPSAPVSSSSKSTASAATHASSTFSTSHTAVASQVAAGASSAKNASTSGALSLSSSFVALVAVTVSGLAVLGL
jgi:chitin deacetylase